jgi:uncharacterized Ntn-hydrolase superfamily protein
MLHTCRRARSVAPPLAAPQLTALLIAALLTTALDVTLPTQIARAAPPAALDANGAENIATFSVCAYDPSTGEVGVAVQSRFFAVGTVVPWARAGVGAVATQAFGNPNYGPRGLDLMAAGVPPSAFLPELLALDGYASQRQIGMVMAAQPPFAVKPPAPQSITQAAAETATEENMTSEELEIAAGKQLSVVRSGLGEAITYTGAECMDWAGGRGGITPDGVIYCVQGNILTGEAVVEAMAGAMQTSDHLLYAGIDPGTFQYEGDPAGQIRRAITTPDLAGRLLYALAEGQAKGGDSRGMQSAALLVCQAGAGYGGYNDVKYDLRVDDAANPFVELARLLNLARPIALGNEAYNKLNSGEMDGAVRLFEQIVSLNPDDAYARYNLACGYSRTGRSADALFHLAAAIKLDPKLAQSAVGDKDLIPLRETEEFRKLTAAP